MSDSIYVPLWLVVLLAVLAAATAGFFGGRATASHSKSPSAADVVQAAAGLQLQYDPPTDVDAVQTDLRLAIPAVEAYFSDHGTYAGMTADGLVTTYDRSIDPAVEVVSASGTTYCVQATHGSATWHKAGPSALYETGSCS